MDFLDSEEQKFLDTLEGTNFNANKITIDVIKRTEKPKFFDQKSIYQEFVDNLSEQSKSLKFKLDYIISSDDDLEDFNDKSTYSEEVEEPSKVPVKEILDLFEEEYLFELNSKITLDRLRKRIEYITNSSSYINQ
jgi:hypothetical protein